MQIIRRTCDMTQVYVGKEGVFEANSENGAGEGVKVNH